MHLMLAKVLSSAILGIDAYVVEVEAHLTGAKLPKFKTVGLPEGAVKESKERVRAAIKNTGFIFPHKHVSIFVMGIMIGSFFLAGCNTNKEQFSLTSKSYEMWRDYITPTENELLWTSIPWRSSFREGLIDADEYQKPLLLWAMNGHPLGCT